MAVDDKKVDWSTQSTQKAKLLSEAEVKAFFLTPEQKQKMKEEEEKKKKEGEKESTLDKKVVPFFVVDPSVDKTLPATSSLEPAAAAAARSVDKTLPAKSVVKTQIKEESVDKTQIKKESVERTLPSSSPLDGVDKPTPALIAWEEQKRKVKEKKERKEREEMEARAAAGVETPPDWNMSSSSSNSSSSKGTAARPSASAQGSFDKREPEAKPCEHGSFDKREPEQAPPDREVPELKQRRLVWQKSPKYRVCVDWFNTIYLQGQGVPDENAAALRNLISRGYDVFLLSYGGHRREQEVRALAQQMDVRWSGLHFTRAKDGPWGKAAFARWLNCHIVIDDDESVLWECHMQGFQYHAIQTNKKKHFWANSVHPSLVDAVQAILR